MLAQARQAQEVSMSNPPEVDPEEARRRQKIQRQLPGERSGIHRDVKRGRGLG
jgi:hypothetical protein